MGDPKIIAIDSGEGSQRRTVSECLLRNLVYTRGIPTVALSIDSQVNKAYLAILPPYLKAKINSLGQFQMYNRICHLAKLIQEELFLDSEGSEVIMNCYLSLVEPLKQKLVEKLIKEDIKVILDRSHLSTVSYSSCLPKSTNEMIVENYYVLAEKLMRQDSLYFFLDTPRLPSYNVMNARLYDLLAPELNISLRNWYRGLNNNLHDNKRVLTLPKGNLNEIISEILKELDRGRTSSPVSVKG